MAKKVGDMLTSEIRRAGLVNVVVTIDRGAGPVAVSLIPSADGSFIEKPIGKKGLNGAFHISYYEQTLLLEYMQTDGETLADLFSSALASQWAIAGVSTAITFMSGKVVTLTMRFEMTPHGEGYDSAFAVTLAGTSKTSTPCFR